MAFLTILKDYQVLISSAAAICSTFFIVRHNRRLAAQKNAVDVIRAINQDNLMQDGLKVISKHHKASGHDISILIEDAVDESNLEDKKKILYVLNQYEHLAVGIKHSIYDERIAKDSSYGTIINMEAECRSLIARTRTIAKSDTIWLNLERLAIKWKDNPLKAKKQFPWR